MFAGYYDFCRFGKDLGLESDWRKGNQSPRELEAVIRSAASADPLGFAEAHQDDRSANGRQGEGRSPTNPREAALADDLITSSLPLGSMASLPSSP